jgi:two-component system chemotaxis response regulator CheY
MPKKIIVVDDSRTVRLQLSNALTDAGFEVIEAVDGKDGVAKIESHLDAAMVICDVNMPNMNGLDMVATVLAGGKRSNLPIIMLTTEAQPALLEEAQRMGAKGWIVKPFNRELLVAAARKLTA